MDEALEKLGPIKIKLKHDLHVKRPRTNKSVEYYNPESTAGYAPQSNSVAKRKNKTLQDMINSM